MVVMLIHDMVKLFCVFLDLVRFHLGQDKQISVVFEDGPDNDFKSMFRTFSGQNICFIF